MDPFENRLRNALRRREPAQEFDEKVLARARSKAKRSSSLWQVLRWSAGHPLRLAVIGGVAITLVAGSIEYHQQRVEDARQAVAEVGTISGKILSMDGTPAAHVRVAAMAVEDAPAVGATSLLSVVETDQAGRYRLEKLPPGRYYIIAGTLAAPTYFPGVSGLSQAGMVDVTGGSELSGKNFSIVIPDVLTVQGRVVREDSAVPARNMFRLIAVDGTVQTTAIEPDGSFQFALRPGTYQVSGLGMVSPSSINVVDRDITGLQLLVPLVVSVSGTLSVADGLPVPGFQLTFTNVNSGAQFSAIPRFFRPDVPVSNEVPFMAQLPRGNYRVTAEGLPVGFAIRSITANSNSLSDDVLTISDSSAPKVSVVLSTSSRALSFKVSGRVTGGGAFVNPGINRRDTVELEGPTVLGGLHAPIGADGTFEFPVVVPGTYRMRLGSGGIPQAAQSTVIVSDRDLTFVIPTPELRQIQGKVSVDGSGAMPRFILYYSRTVVREDSASSSGTSVPVTPGADGAFSVSLPDGEYDIGIDSTNPAGYSVKSFRYGATDLLENPIVVDGNSRTLQITLAGVNEANTKGIPTLAHTTYLNLAEYPGIISRVPAIYSDEGRNNKIQGGVTLQLTIHSDGTLDPNIDVVRSLGYGLENQAIEAVRRWTFRPGVKNGVPVQGKMLIEIIFRF